jgi:hypothetical protein
VPLPASYSPVCHLLVEVGFSGYAACTRTKLSGLEAGSEVKRRINDTKCMLLFIPCMGTMKQTGVNNRRGWRCVYYVKEWGEDKRYSK